MSERNEASTLPKHFNAGNSKRVLLVSSPFLPAQSFGRGIAHRGSDEFAEFGMREGAGERLAFRGRGSDAILIGASSRREVFRVKAANRQSLQGSLFASVMVTTLRANALSVSE